MIPTSVEAFVLDTEFERLFLFEQIESNVAQDSEVGSAKILA